MHIFKTEDVLQIGGAPKAVNAWARASVTTTATKWPIGCCADGSSFPPSVVTIRHYGEHLFRNTLTLESSLFAMTRSGLLSPFRSAAAIAVGNTPVY